MRIDLQNIHKRYGSVKANNGVALTVDPGSIHGILGENGAGKSTLMKILSGYTRKTSGAILLDGSPADYRTPAEASEMGIGMLYQDPLDFPLLSVLENFMLGQRSSELEAGSSKLEAGSSKLEAIGSKLKAGSSKLKAKLKAASSMFEKTPIAAYSLQLAALIRQFNFTLEPDALVKSLTIGERQQLEILRLLAMGIRTLILDEPTTGISSLQKETLFQALRKLAVEGESVILVSQIGGCGGAVTG